MFRQHPTPNDAKLRRTATVNGKWLTNVNQTVASDPIFEVHAGHATKFANIAGDPNKTEGTGVTADHHVVGSETGSAFGDSVLA
jgi:hypothetical protein